MLCNLPFVESTLIGREEELAFLDNAWANPVTNFVQIIASGGTGKTALVDRWFRRHLIEAAIFVWSFFSQGTSARRQTSVRPVFRRDSLLAPYQALSHGLDLCYG